MKKIVFIFLGVISVLLGLVGVVIPLLPTTPFILIAAFLFFRSSPWFYKVLTKSKFPGRYYQYYVTYRAIPLGTKIVSISLLWISILYAIFYVVENVYLKIFLLVIAVLVSIHILSFKTLKKK